MWLSYDDPDRSTASFRPIKHTMAMRLGSPRFMLHDLREMPATVGEKLGFGDAVLRRILNRTAPKTDVLHQH